MKTSAMSALKIDANIVLKISISAGKLGKMSKKNFHMITTLWDV